MPQQAISKLTSVFFAHAAVAIDVALDWLKVDVLPLSIFLFASFRSVSS